MKSRIRQFRAKSEAIRRRLEERDREIGREPERERNLGYGTVRREVWAAIARDRRGQ